MLQRRDRRLTNRRACPRVVLWLLFCLENRSEQLQAGRTISVPQKCQHLSWIQQRKRLESPSSQGTAALNSQCTKDVRPRRREPSKQVLDSPSTVLSRLDLCLTGNRWSRRALSPAALNKKFARREEWRAVSKPRPVLSKIKWFDYAPKIFEC